MRGWYILDEELNPRKVDVIEASLWEASLSVEECLKRVQVDYTEINEKTSLSTVFLKLDHGRGDKILLYESMWFGGPLDGECRRYSTRQEAANGHQDMLKKYYDEYYEPTINMKKIAKEIAERCFDVK